MPKLLPASLGNKKYVGCSTDSEIVTWTWIWHLLLFWPNYLKHISLPKFWRQLIDNISAA